MTGIASLAVPVRKACTDALATYFEGLPGFNSGDDLVTVTYAYSFGPDRARQWVYTGRSSAETPPAYMKSGANHKKERGEFELVVRIEVPGGDGYASDLRLDEVATYVEEWFDARKQGDGLAVSGLQSLKLTRWVGDYAGVEGGSVSIRAYTVEWTAHLT